MSDIGLEALGRQVAALRISRQLKQSELAYEAGVSHRTLQRLEAGEAIRSDGLLRIFRCLGRLDEVLSALDVAASPYELLSSEGLQVSELDRRKSEGRERSRRQRVRRSARTAGTQNKVKIQWPEDQQ